MEKINLTPQDYALALFVLCADIACWDVKREEISYYYFCPQRQKDLSVIRYILKANNVNASVHRSRYYCGKRVLRVPAGVFLDEVDDEFQRELKKIRSDKNVLTDRIVKHHILFGVWSKNHKAKFIRDFVGHSR